MSILCSCNECTTLREYQSALAAFVCKAVEPSNSIVAIKNYKSGETCEYYCGTCKQLRLSVDMTPRECANCGATDIIMGSVGSLNREDYE